MEKKKLLLVHHGALGDLVTTFPVIIKLKKIFHQIDLVSQQKLGRLAQSLNVIEDWFSLESASFASLYSSVVDPKVKRLLGSYHDVILFSRSRQLQYSIKKITGKTPYLIPPRPDKHRRIHIAQHILSSMVRFGLLTEEHAAPSSKVSMPKPPFARLSKKDPKKILLHPGSGSIKKCWPVKNFMTLASSLASQGNRPEYILGPAEYFLAEKLSQNNQHRLKIHIMDDLVQLSSLLKTADAFIGNDSGLSHLAAFIGLPTVAVFGPSDPKRWEPNGRAVTVVRPDLACSPCFETNPDACNEMKCFNKTLPETVTDAVNRVIKRTVCN